MAEALETAERSGVELNVSHLYPRAVEDDAAADALLAMLDDARSRGVEVTFDLTIFERGGGAWIQSLPAWARDGGMAGTTAAIRDPASRARIIEALTAPGADHWLDDWEDQIVCKVNRPEHADLAGRSVADIARERGTSPMDTALDLVLEDGQWWVSPTIKRQAHLDRLIASPLCVPIGDGFAHHPERHRAYGIMPKSFGTFPLVAGLVRPRPRRPDARGCDPADHLGARSAAGDRRPRPARRGARGGPRPVRSGDRREPGDHRGPGRPSGGDLAGHGRWRVGRDRRGGHRRTDRPDAMTRPGHRTPRPWEA